MLRKMFAVAAATALATGSASVAIAGQPSPDARQARTGQIVVSTTSPAEVDSGAAVPLTVQFPGVTVGDVARLQERRPGSNKWLVVSKTTVPESRTLEMSPRAAGGGMHAWRVKVRVAPEKTLTSNVVRVTAYAWYWLTDLDTVTSSGNWDDDLGTVAIGGQPYRHAVGSLWSAASFGGWLHGEAEYNLSYRCRAFTARVGLPDDSGSLAQWNFATSVDGTETDHGWHGIGPATEITVDVTGGFRLELANARLDGDPYQDYKADAAWGSAKLSCAGKP